MALGEFVPLVGQMFEVDCSPKAIAIRLIEASPARFGGQGLKEPFRLVFHSTPDIMLIEAIYVMRCGTFGPESIYLGSMVSPIGAAPGYYYQASFN